MLWVIAQIEGLFRIVNLLSISKKIHCDNFCNRLKMTIVINVHNEDVGTQQKNYNIETSWKCRFVFIPVLIPSACQLVFCKFMNSYHRSVYLEELFYFGFTL